MKKERILGPISMPCFVTMLEAPFLLPQAARVLGEEASLGQQHPMPRPPPPAGLLLAEAQVLAVAG